MRQIIFILSIIFCFTLTKAENTAVEFERQTTSAYSAEWGYSSILDTYLSPLKYTGYSAGISGQWLKPMRQNPKRLIMAFDATLSGDINMNPTRSSYMYALQLDFAWNMQYRWKPIPQLQLSAGGGLALNAGAIYLQRNSNNPVSAKASIDITINGMAAYSLNIGKLPIRLIDQLSIPTLGSFFSPDYGETYYEIYLGNHSGLIHCGWWGNHFRLNNLIAADITLGKASLRIGYRFNLNTSYVNNLNTQMVQHSLIIGAVSDWINTTDNIPTSNIIPAYY